MPTRTNEELSELVQRLQSENAALHQRLGSASSSTPPPERPHGGWKRNSWGWTLLATILIVIGALLAPVALIGNWADRQLADTETFVDTFAPLAQDPAVQAFIADEVTTEITHHIDAAQLTSNLVDGISALGLKPRAEAALRALEAPAVQAIESFVHDTVDKLVTSPQFAALFERALRTSHDQLIATMEGDPNALVEIESDGTIGIQLAPVVDAVKDALVDRGITIATRIPEVDRTIVIATADAAPIAQTFYALATMLGTWLPWVSLLLLAAGVLVARRRARALIWAAVALAVSVLLTLAGIGIAKPIVVGLLAPSIMPADAAGSVYEATVAMVWSIAVAVAVLAITIAIVAWLAGPFRVPRRLRAVGTSAAAMIRSAGEGHDLTTGAVGEWLYRMRVPLRVLVALAGAAVVLFTRPLSPAVIVWTAVSAILIIAVLEVIQRPPALEPAARTVGSLGTGV